MWPTWYTPVTSIYICPVWFTSVTNLYYVQVMDIIQIHSMCYLSYNCLCYVQYGIPQLQLSMLCPVWYTSVTAVRASRMVNIRYKIQISQKKCRQTKLKITSIENISLSPMERGNMHIHSPSKRGARQRGGVQNTPGRLNEYRFHVYAYSVVNEAAKRKVALAK